MPLLQPLLCDCTRTAQDIVHARRRERRVPQVVTQPDERERDHEQESLLKSPHQSVARKSRP